MLPAPKSDRLSLADVMPACLSAISGEPNRLGLPRATKVVVLLVDGLGAAALKARAGHARTLMSYLSGSSVIDSGFPTTTASALATLTTGTAPGQHGMVGYTVLDPANDRVLKQLSGWDAKIDPYAWQPMPTVFERAVELGHSAVVVGPERYRDSGFSKAVLRGAEYLGASSIGDRLERCAEWLAEPGTGIAYVYVPELDVAGHASGAESVEWTNWLEILDVAVREFATKLGADHGLLITADHGVVDIAERHHVLFDTVPALIDGVKFVAGEPRCLQLHFDPAAGQDVRDATIAAWREAEGARAWIATRAEAIAAGWFGEVRAEVEPRIGDLLIAARKGIAYYDSRTLKNGHGMVGHHGSWSPAEVQVPLLRLGAFARK
jgi:predicted AlkP superfamily pyrophosphatase or phosphodiesterase